MEVNNAVFLKCNKIGFFEIFFDKGNVFDTFVRTQEYTYNVFL